MPSAALITNPGAAFDGDAGVNDVRQAYRNTSATAIAKGDLVVLDTSVPSTTTYPGNVPGANASISGATADLVTVIGFAAEAAASGAVFDCIVGGLARQVNVATGTAAGTRVSSSTTAGRAAAPAVATPGSVIGIVVGATAASNLADVYVFKA